MALNSKEYWKRREEEQLKHNITEEAAYSAELDRIYANMLDSVQTQIDGFYGKYATKEGISLAEAKKRVKNLDIEAYERKAAKYVAEKNFSKQANEEMRLYNATMKINRLELLKAQIGLETIAGHDELEKYMESILQGRTMDELKRQAGILGKSITNNAKAANAIVNGSFHSGTFSDRIWQYQDLMRSDLEGILARGLIQGKNPRAIASDLKKYWYGNDPLTGGGARYCMERLMRTELARVQTEAQKQSFERNGFTMYMFIENGDCCPICKQTAKKDSGHGAGIYLVKDMMPGTNAPPMHPNCRCSVAAHDDDAEYEAWLDYISKGGTTENWHNYKKGLEKSGKINIIEAVASKLPNRFKKFLPENGRRLQIIEEGKNLDKPIFDNGILGKFAQNIIPKANYYDITMHGSKYGVEYFGENIDVETLCAIIAQRQDYTKGTKIRLISCNTGEASDGVAQYVANKLHVEVIAPNKKAIIERKANGETIVYSGSEEYVHDGEFISFFPQDEVK